MLQPIIRTRRDARRDVLRTSCVIAFLLVASFALAQSEFSAEMVDTEKSGNPTQAKIYLARDKIRIESGVGNAKGSGAVIMNLATQTYTVLMDKQHMYMEMPTQTTGQRTMYNFFHTGDVESACVDWLQQAKNKGGSCHKEGENGGGELRNIQEGTQPASLFAIPAGYTKMDMGGMMQRPQ